MHKKYVYSSVFANLLNDYISAHREAGFMYEHQVFWLYRIVNQCPKKHVKEAIITKPLFEA